MLFKRYFITGSYDAYTGGSSEFWVIYRIWFYQSATTAVKQVIAQKSKRGSNVMISQVNRL